MPLQRISKQQFSNPTAVNCTAHFVYEHSIFPLVIFFIGNPRGTEIDLYLSLLIAGQAVLLGTGSDYSSNFNNASHSLKKPKNDYF